MRRDDARRTLIAYDIPDDRRRTKAAKVLLSYGDRVQYSVFVVDVSTAKLIELKTELRDVIELQLDSVLFCDLGLLASIDDDKFSYMGVEREITDNDFLVF